MTLGSKHLDTARFIRAAKDHVISHILSFQAKLITDC